MNDRAHAASQMHHQGFPLEQLELNKLYLCRLSRRPILIAEVVTHEDTPEGVVKRKEPLVMGLAFTPHDGRYLLFSVEQYQLMPLPMPKNYTGEKPLPTE